MPVTGPVTYYWVGGATGTTSASRFDWNVASNWRIRRTPNEHPSEFNLITPQMWPVGGDNVRLGYGWAFTPGATSSHRINSPLLFGGFSGSGGTGCWICGGETGAGLCGASGTTLQAVLTNFTVDAYPFNGIGGGLTGNNIYGWPAPDYLSNSMSVSGMDRTAWEALANAASTRQQSLNLKVTYIYHNGHTGSYQGYSPWFAPNIIDTYSTYGVSGSTGYISTDIRYAAITTPNSLTYPNLYLKNSKIYQVIKYSAGGATGGVSSVGADPINLYVTNCKIGQISLPAAGQIYIDNDSLIGKIKLTVDTYGRILDNQWLYASLGGTYRYPNAFKSLGWPGVTLDTGSEIEIVYKGTGDYQQAFIALGGFTWANGTTGTFTANKVYVNYTNSGGFTLQQGVAIAAKSSIGEIELYGAELYSDLDPLSGSIDVNTIRLNDNSTLNFRKNSAFNNWRIGVASGNASGVTLNGGIVFESDTASIKGDPGLRFINYAKAGGNVDIRNSKIIDTLEITPPVSGTA